MPADSTPKGEQRFKVHSAGFSIPWSYVEPLRALADEVHGQTLERLHERGGLDRSEIGGLLVGRNVFGAGDNHLHGCADSLPLTRLYVPTDHPALLSKDEARMAAAFLEGCEPGSKGDNLYQRLRDYAGDLLEGGGG